MDGGRGVITINQILLRFAFHGESVSFGIKKIKTEREMTSRWSLGLAEMDIPATAVCKHQVKDLWVVGHHYVWHGLRPGGGMICFILSFFFMFLYVR